MAGTLNYKNYLNTLQTLTEVGNIFPSDQKTWTYTVEGGGTQGWTAEISWVTLVIDQMSYDSNNRPVFDDSLVFGYYQGGTAEEYSNGTISIPANMYTGPILPASTFWIPITVVNVRWTKDGNTYANNIAFIQNWEPGVQPLSPVYGDGFIPVVSEPSTLTLAGPGAVVWGRTLSMTATSDIPIFLGEDATAYFWWDNPGGRILLGTALFSGNTATLNYNTNLLVQPPPAGTIFPIYAEFSGVRQYGFQRSNTVNQLVLGHIPLVVESEIFNPSKAAYDISDQLTYTLTVVPDPSYPVTGVPVGNTVTVYRRDAPITGLPNPPSRPDVLLTTTTFVNGVISLEENITSSLVDTSPYFTYADLVTINTSTLTSSTYTFNATVQNGYYFYSNWGAFFDGPYATGSRISSRYIVTTDVDRSYIGQEFPISISRTPTESFQTQPVVFNLSVPNRFYSGPVTLIGTTIVEGVETTSTLATFSYGTTSRSVVFNTTGTWTISASYAGDLGTSYYPNRINLPSSSNTISHYVREGNTLRTELAFERTTSTDIVRIIGYFNGVLPRDISFYQGSTLLTTASWIRSTTNEISYDSVLRSQSKKVKPANYSDRSAGWPVYGGYGSTAFKTSQITYWPVVGVNKYQLYRYKAPNESASSYLANPLDTYSVNPNPITSNADFWARTGDSRGYNVIGFDDNAAPETGYLPRTVTVNSVTLTLVEYLGETPNRSQGASVRKLFRFTPTIIQSNDTFPVFAYDSSYPGANYSGFGGPASYRYTYPLPNGQVPPLPPGCPTGNPGNTYLDRNDGQIYVSLPWPLRNGRRIDYGIYWSAVGRLSSIDSWKTFNNKQWPITNWNDPVLRARQDQGRTWFAGVISSGNTVEIAEYFEQVPDITSVFKDTNYAILELPLGTITDVDSLRASWPGTLDLGYEFGKFYPVEINASGAPTSTIISSRFDVVKANYFSEDFRHGSTLTNIVYAVNPVILKAQVLVNPELGTSTSGSVNFYNADNETLVGTAITENGIAELQVVAGDFAATSQNVNVKAVFDGATSGLSTSTNWPMQIIDTEFQLADFTFHDRPQFQWFDTTLDPVPKFGARWEGDWAPQIVRHTVKTFFKNSYSGRSGTVSIGGSLDLLIPFCNYRGEFRYGLPQSPTYGPRIYDSVFRPEGGPYSYQTPYGTTYFQENGQSTIVFLLYAQINYANGNTAIVPVNRTSSLGHAYTYQTYTGATPVSRTISYNSNSLPVTWAENWISIDLFLDAAGWEFKSNQSDNTLASIAPGSKLGYKVNFNI